MVQFTRQQLEDLPLNRWDALKSSVDSIQQDQHDQGDQIVRAPELEGEEWTGDGGAAARSKAQAIQKALTAKSEVDGKLKSVLDTALQDFWSKRTDIHLNIKEIEDTHLAFRLSDGDHLYEHPLVVGQGFDVQVNGGSQPQPPITKAEDLADVRQQLDTRRNDRQKGLTDLLQKFVDADAEHSAALDQIKYDDVAKAQPASPDQAAHDEAREIAAGEKPLPTDPKELHDLWQHLSDGEKDVLFAKDPHIGDKDGIPAVDRDKYNRKTLDSEIDAEGQEVQRIKDEHKDWNLDHPPGNPGSNEGRAWRAWKNRVDAAQGRLNTDTDFRTRALADNPKFPHRFLLQHDGKGHGIVAVGNPDKAKNVTTFVPGTGEHLDHLAGSMGRVEAMYGSAVKAGSPPDGTSVVAWYGYDAPDWVGQNNPSSSAGAEGGAPLLDSFQEGLRVTHEGAPSHNTVVAHSYGSVVAGQAASHGRTLNADDVIFAGSPGVDVHSVRDLHLTGVNADQVAYHVWAAADPNDPVPKTANIPVIHGPFGIPIPALPGTGLGIFGHPAHDLAPSDPDFGLPQGQIIHVDPHPATTLDPTDPHGPFSPHSQYWDETPGKDGALTGMGQIINRPKT